MGRVRWYCASRACGFIEWEGHRDVFVHPSALDEETAFRGLREGTPVRFEVSYDAMGPRAERILLV